MTHLSSCLWTNYGLFQQLAHYSSVPGINSLQKDQDPADGGLYMMGDDDLDILTEIYEWVEREDIAEITEDLDSECQDDPVTDLHLPAY